MSMAGGPNELRERREQIERLQRARQQLDRVKRWEHVWMRWGWRVALLVALTVFSIALGREFVKWSH